METLGLICGRRSAQLSSTIQADRVAILQSSCSWPDDARRPRQICEDLDVILHHEHQHLCSAADLSPQHARRRDLLRQPSYLCFDLFRGAVTASRQATQHLFRGAVTASRQATQTHSLNP